MTKQLHERDWTEVHAALDAYYAHESTFNFTSDKVARSNNLDGSAIFEAWFAKQDKLRLACGMAFVEATLDINGRHHAAVVGLGFVEKCSAYVPTNERG